MTQKTSAFILATGEFHEKMAAKAAKSFQHFHPEIGIEVVTSERFKEYQCSVYKKDNYNIPVSLLKILAAYEFMASHEVDKLIFLGADTITCGRLDELLDDNKSDVVVTACYPYQIQSIDNSTLINTDKNPITFFRSLILIQDKNSKELILTDISVYQLDKEKYTLVEYYLANPDVACYNNLAVLATQINEFKRFSFSYCEFGSLNYALKHHTFSFADLNPTYAESKVAYNSRPKIDQANPHTRDFTVKNDKLYSPDGKHIKVYHFQEQFTKGVDYYSLDETYKAYASTMKERLNDETVNYFNEVLEVDIFNL